MFSKDEAVRFKPYDDSTGRAPIISGKLTIGIGRNLTDRGITQDEVEYLFQNDFKYAVADALSIFPEFEFYSTYRKLAILNMLFIGRARFLGFTEMIKAIKAKDWIRAAEEAKNSLWYTQVKSRGQRVVDLFLHKGDPYNFNIKGAL